MLRADWETKRPRFVLIEEENFGKWKKHWGPFSMRTKRGRFVSQPLTLRANEVTHKTQRTAMASAPRRFFSFIVWV